MLCERKYHLSKIKVTFCKHFFGPQEIVFKLSPFFLFLFPYMVYFVDKFSGTVEVQEYPEVPNSTLLKITFTLKFVNEVDLSDSIDLFCSEGSTESRPIDAISVVNTILGK